MMNVFEEEGEIMKVEKALSIRWVMFPPRHELSVRVTPLALSSHTGGP